MGLEKPVDTSDGATTLLNSEEKMKPLELLSSYIVNASTACKFSLNDVPSYSKFLQEEE